MLITRFLAACTAIAFSPLVLAVPVRSDNGKPTFDPTKFYFKAGEKTAVLTVYNNQNIPVIWNIEPFLWTQGKTAKIGADELASTTEIQIEPSYIELKPHEEAPVVIRYVGNDPGSVEASYRLKLTSGYVRQGDADVVFTQSLPVFIEPKEIFSKINIALYFSKEGRLSLRLTNLGNRHVFVSKMVISGLKSQEKPVFEIDTPGWYLLPGKEAIYAADINSEDCRLATKFSSNVEFRDGSREKSELSGPVWCAKGNQDPTGFESNAKKLSSMQGLPSAKR